MKPAAKILFFAAAALWTAAAEGVLLTTWKFPPNLKALEAEQVRSSAMATLSYLNPTINSGTAMSAYQWAMSGSLAGAAVSLGGTSFAPSRSGAWSESAGDGEESDEDDAALLAYLFGDDDGEFAERLAHWKKDSAATARGGMLAVLDWPGSGERDAFKPLYEKVTGWGMGRIAEEKGDVLAFVLGKPAGGGREEGHFDYVAAWGKINRRTKPLGGALAAGAGMLPVAMAELPPPTVVKLSPEAVAGVPLEALVETPPAVVVKLPREKVEEAPETQEESPRTIAHESQWRLFEATPILDWVQSTIPEVEPLEPLWKRGWTD